jgi:hypothetical protein
MYDDENPRIVLDADPTIAPHVAVGATKHSVTYDRIDARSTLGKFKPFGSALQPIWYASESDLDINFEFQPTMTATTNQDRPTRSEALLRAAAYRANYRAEQDYEEKVLGGYDLNKKCEQHFIALSANGLCSMCE